MNLFTGGLPSLIGEKAAFTGGLPSLTGELSRFTGSLHTPM
ncbi:hypothetical protein [Bacillus sp. MUM 116]|nr:hypothetical protein [Bacillus sp. MUM 116]